VLPRKRWCRSTAIDAPGSWIPRHAEGMPRVVDTAHLRPALAALIGSCDVEGGPTDEQFALAGALATGYFHTTVDPRSVQPLGPDEASEQLDDEVLRTRVFHLMVVAEFCRHPLTRSQVLRTEDYARAFGISDEGQRLARDLMAAGNAVAEADYLRIFNDHRLELEEPVLAHHGDGGAGTVPDEVFERLTHLGDCPPGSLGRAFAEFYAANGLELPGPDDPYAGVFVAHDMSHVIAGYEATGLEEVALGAMQIGIADTEVHWVQFLGNIGVHEARFIHHTDGPPVLAAPGAMEVLAHAFDRGSATAEDFTLVDHLSMVDLPLEEVRERFGVPPRER